MGQLVSTPDSPKTLTLSIGAASPLWLAFVGAASAGVAYWWMTRWARSPRVPAAPSIALEAPVEAAAVVEALEPEKVVVEAPTTIAAPVEALAVSESTPPPPAESPVIKKTVVKAPKPATAAPAKGGASAPAIAKAIPKAKASKGVIAETRIEPQAPKPAARKPAIKRSVKNA